MPEAWLRHDPLRVKNGERETAVSHTQGCPARLRRRYAGARSDEPEGAAGRAQARAIGTDAHWRSAIGARAWRRRRSPAPWSASRGRRGAARRSGDRLATSRGPASSRPHRAQARQQRGGGRPHWALPVGKAGPCRRASDLSVILRELGRLDEAITAAERAIALRPGHARAHTNLGNLLRQRGRLADAARAHATAVQAGSAERRPRTPISPTRSSPRIVRGKRWRPATGRSPWLPDSPKPRASEPKPCSDWAGMPRP